MELQAQKIIMSWVTSHQAMDSLPILHVRKLTIMVRCMVAREDLEVAVRLDIQAPQASHHTRNMEGLETLKKAAVMAKHQNLLAVQATTREATM